MTIDAFYDLVNNTLQPPILVRANLQLLRTEDGGRKSGIRSGYRPNHNFGGTDNQKFYIGQIEFEPDITIEQGESHEVLVRFIFTPDLKRLLQKEHDWKIQKVYQLVGKATILEVKHEI